MKNLMEKVYREDEVNRYKKAINEHDKFLYWLKKRIEEDERNINISYGTLPSMNYALVHANKNSVLDVIKIMLRSLIP